MKRRNLLGTLVSGIALPFEARAREQALPVIAFISTGSAQGSAPRAAAFRAGLADAGFFDGQNATIEYHWLEGHTTELARIIDDVVRRKVAVIAAPGSIVSAIAAKAATTTIPIVFGSPEDPVALGLVSSLAQPGGNATGVNSFSQEVVGKRLELLHDLVPTATQVTVLVNPNNASSAKTTSQGVKEAAPALGMQAEFVNATTVDQIDAAVGAVVGNGAKVLFVAPDAFFNSLGSKFSALTVRNRIPSAYSAYEVVEAGGLMSYGSDLFDMARLVGVYVGKVLKGARPAALPVQQSTKLVFAVNLQTARALGIEVPPRVLALADRVVE